MSPFNSKIATVPFQGSNQVEFTPDNTDFKEHFRLNQRTMRSDYLNRISKTGEEPSSLADEAFGMGEFSTSGPHPSLLGRSLDQFSGIRLVPKVAPGKTKRTTQMLRQKALAINPENPGLNQYSEPLPGNPSEVTLGHLLQTPSFLVTGADGTPRSLGSVEDSNGVTHDYHPTTSLTRGLIVERHLREKAMQRLQSHPAIKMHAGEIKWTPEAHNAVQEEVSKFRRNVHGLYHGGGVTLEDGTHIPSVFLSKNAAGFICDVDEHFEPHPEDRNLWDKAITAFGNVTKGTGTRTMSDRAHSPWAQVYDTSFQRRIETGDDETLKDVFKTHLGESGQHRYVASAPTAPTSLETSIWKTALADRMRKGTRGISSGIPEPSQAEKARSPEVKEFKKRRFSSLKARKFFFNPSKLK